MQHLTDLAHLSDELLPVSGKQLKRDRQFEMVFGFIGRSNRSSEVMRELRCRLLVRTFDDIRGDGGGGP